MCFFIDELREIQKLLFLWPDVCGVTRVRMNTFTQNPYRGHRRRLRSTADTSGLGSGGALEGARCERRGLCCVSCILFFSPLSPLNSLRLSPQPPPLLVRQKSASPTSVFTGTFFPSLHWLPGPHWGVRERHSRCGFLMSSSLS